MDQGGDLSTWLSSRRDTQRHRDLPFQFQFNCVCFPESFLALGDGRQEKQTEVGQGGAWLWGTGYSWKKSGGTARKLKWKGSLVRVVSLYGLS